MGRKNVTCDLLRERYEALSGQREVCSRLLVTKGPLSGEFIEVFRVFEEGRKELKYLLAVYRQWRWMEGLPITELRRSYDTVGEYLKELWHMRGYLFFEGCKSMLGNMEIRETDGRSLTLVKVTQKDLGLTEGSTLGDMLAAAEKKGLKRCPAWAGLQYCLDYDPGHIYFGTEPVPDSDGQPGVFLAHKDSVSRSFHSHDVLDSSHPGREWVFVVPG